jgi:predicted DCC family thiol-disulfide oxidoreductase YuxK
VNFIIRHDPEGRFRFAPMQSDAARELIRAYAGSGFDFSTLLLVKDHRCYERGDAVVEILKELKGCRLLRGFFRLLPGPLRDGLYKAVAKRRYRLFGRREECMVPTREVLDRFVQ